MQKKPVMVMTGLGGRLFERPAGMQLAAALVSAMGAGGDRESWPGLKAQTSTAEPEVGSRQRKRWMQKQSRKANRKRR